MVSQKQLQALAAINADIKNLPSSPISTTPERSANRPAIDAKIRGTQTRTDASNVNTVLKKNITHSVTSIGAKKRIKIGR